MFQKHSVAGHFARDDSHTVAEVFHCRDLSWRRQQQQSWEVNGNTRSGVALSTRRLLEMGTRLRALGRDVCGENEDAINVGWKATAQLRPEWKALEQQF